MKTAVPLAVMLALALAAPLASAQAPDEATVAEARRIFEEAEAAFESRRFQSAADLYQRSYDLLDGHPNQYLVLFNIAQSLARTGRYDDAIAGFQRYVREGGDRVQNRGEVDERIAELEDLRGGPGPVTAEDAGPDEGLLVGSITGFGVGVLALGAMGIFGGLAIAEHDALAAGCGATRSCTSSDVADSNTFALVADVNLAIAGVALATGVVLLILALTSSDEEAVANLLRPSPYALGGPEVLRW
ncbi:MAG: tetratricopeptide repeat protein [Sandaracinaceae bacterium]|nr:tetratricopeptide repeat protein [Sandaracinaceae bacterium]